MGAPEKITFSQSAWDQEQHLRKMMHEAGADAAPEAAEEVPTVDLSKAESLYDSMALDQLVGLEEQLGIEESQNRAMLERKIARIEEQRANVREALERRRNEGEQQAA